MSVGHSSPSCGTVIFLLLVSNSIKTCIISVDLGKTLVTLFSVQQIHSNFKPSCKIDRGHIKVPQNKFKYTKYVGNTKYRFLKISF